MQPVVPLSALDWVRVSSLRLRLWPSSHTPSPSQRAHRLLSWMHSQAKLQVANLRHQTAKTGVAQLEASVHITGEHMVQKYGCSTVLGLSVNTTVDENSSEAGGTGCILGTHVSCTGLGRGDNWETHLLSLEYQHWIQLGIPEK